jgi:hypothetical protein
LPSRGLAPTTGKLYLRLLRLHVLPGFRRWDLVEITAPRVRTWRAELLDERPVATVEQVDALADTVGPRWRLMVFLAAYAGLRPEEQAELRRTGITCCRRARRAVPPLDIRPQVAQVPRRRRSPAQLPLLRPGFVGECRGMQPGA